MKKASLVSFLLLTACVTINIYFPAAATEKVADEIIKGIQESQDIPPQSQHQNAALPEWKVSLFRAIDSGISLIISSAHAEANLSVNSTTIRKIRSSMKSRFPALRTYYIQGVIGINVNGLLSPHGNVPLKARNTVKKLISAENNDRESLYAAIANANGHPEWHAQIKATFSRSWVKHAQSGWWYQDGGRWVQK
mgnify:CR=1 FL=1